MAVPHIFAGTAGGTTAQFDANNAYLDDRCKNLNSDGSGNVQIGTSTGVTGRRLVIAGGGQRLDNDQNLEWGGSSAGLYGNSTSNTVTVFTNTTARVNVSSSGLTPATDNALPLGGASFRWSVVYAGTGTINTSDAREKTAVRGLSPAELAASKALAAEVGAFKFLSAVAQKGDAARLHVGLTVQRAMEVMAAHGLDPLAYGFICYDSWQASTIPARYELRPSGTFDADGEELMTPVEIVPAQSIPAGNRYGFRADELMLFLARGFDARLSALEA